MRPIPHDGRWFRRSLLQSTGAPALATALASRTGFSCRHDGASAARGLPAVTTREKTAAPGEPLVAGLPYRQLEPANGWPIVVRNDLSTTNPVPATKRNALVSFVHLTDIHIVDAASPGHPAFLRQYQGGFAGADFTSGFRPQETLTTHVVNTMIRRLNEIGVGAVSGRPFDFAISTGDNADSRGTHEQQALLTSFNGGEVYFNAAGGPYTGIQDNATNQPAAVYDAFWHPEPAPAIFGDDAWKREHGFPTLPGFLEAISQPVAAAGLTMPWYGGYGNHDAVLMGVVPDGSAAAFLLSAFAPGDQLPLAIPDGMSVEAFFGELAQPGDAGVETLMRRMPTRPVPAAASRASFTKRDFVAMHLAGDGRFGPSGHGFSQENADRGTAYYQFTMAPGITGFMLDTTNANGGPDGSLEPEQAAWLEDAVIQVHGRYVSPNGQWVETGHENELVVLFSHHNSITFDNLTTAPGETSSDRLNWAAFSALVKRFPNIILWVNGHTHTNRVWAHADSSGRTGGFWEVNTAAHIDYPQESRIIEILDNGNGVLSITGVMVDAGDAELIPTSPPYDVDSLAALALELAANDPALNLPFRLGNVTDRNVELMIQKPF
ncbi:MAG: TIGR03767 family metallophosphoesterase [Chloroflexota bacterium]|nr:TIGR03767 family metallophosphoesterase [Chloroflexota bacterium]